MEISNDYLRLQSVLLLSGVGYFKGSKPSRLQEISGGSASFPLIVLDTIILVLKTMTQT